MENIIVEGCSDESDIFKDYFLFKSVIFNIGSYLYATLENKYCVVFIFLFNWRNTPVYHYVLYRNLRRQYLLYSLMYSSSGRNIERDSARLKKISVK